MNDQGCPSSSLEEVGRVFVNYFQQQLGTSTPTIPLDSEVINSGPCLPSSSHALMLSCFLRSPQMISARWSSA
jgi:hypothetical protein